MKIIKEGKSQPSDDTPVRFTCKTCGCEFLAEKGEYDTYVNFKDLRTTCSSYCPNCKSWVETDRINTEGDDTMLRMG